MPGEDHNPYAAPVPTIRDDGLLLDLRRLEYWMFWPFIFAIGGPFGIVASVVSVAANAVIGMLRIPSAFKLTLLAIMPVCLFLAIGILSVPSLGANPSSDFRSLQNTIDSEPLPAGN